MYWSVELQHYCFDLLKWSWLWKSGSFRRVICLDKKTPMSSGHEKWLRTHISYDLRTIDKAGPTSGLLLTLNVGVSRYDPTTPTAGARVLVHQNKDRPFPEEKSVLVSPGFFTSVGVRMVSDNVWHLGSEVNRTRISLGFFPPFFFLGGGGILVI